MTITLFTIAKFVIMVMSVIVLIRVFIALVRGSQRFIVVRVVITIFGC